MTLTEDNRHSTVMRLLAAVKDKFKEVCMCMDNDPGQGGLEPTTAMHEHSEGGKPNSWKLMPNSYDLNSFEIVKPWRTQILNPKT